MDNETFSNMSHQQEYHWWFRARKAILKNKISQLDLAPKSKILEIGCGTGANLSMLSHFGDTYALDKSEYALNIAKANNKGCFIKGELPSKLNISNQKFDLICIFDVLEHIKEDTESLSAISKHLKSDGKIIITVPSIPLLFGPHDIKLHHFRRYTKTELKNKLEMSGLKIDYLSHFNFTLLPIAVIARLIDLFRSKSSSLDNMPSPRVNNILYKIFSAESIVLSHHTLPIGLSLLCIAKLKY